MIEYNFLKKKTILQKHTWKPQSFSQTNLKFEKTKLSDFPGASFHLQYVFVLHAEKRSFTLTTQFRNNEPLFSQFQRSSIVVPFLFSLRRFFRHTLTHPDRKCKKNPKKAATELIPAIINGHFSSGSRR